MSHQYRVIENPFSWLNDHSIPLITINNEVDMMSGPYLLGLLNKNIAIGSIRLKAYGIISFYHFCESQDIDFIKMMRELDPWTIRRVEALSAFLKAHKETGELVSENTYRAKMLAVKEFLLYWWDTYQARTVNNQEKLTHARNKREVMEEAFNLEMKVTWSSPTKTRKGLEPELKARFMEIINPYSELNPFKYEHVKWRNFAAILTMILGGNRRGETALLRLQDIQLMGRDKYYEIVKNPRRAPPKTGHMIEPSVKTKGRKISLSDDVATVFEHYIKKHRNKFKGARKSEFLFMSTHGGKPLALSSYNTVLYELIDAFPEFKGHLTPHRLRNTFHDDLLEEGTETIAKNNPDASPHMKESMLREAQIHAGGWSEKSNMPDKYPIGAIERMCAKLTKRIQDKGLAETSNGK